MALGLSLLAHGVLVPTWWLATTSHEPLPAAAHARAGRVLTVRLPMWLARVSADPLEPVPPVVSSHAALPDPAPVPDPPRPTLLVPSEASFPSPLASARAPEPSSRLWQVRAARGDAAVEPAEVMTPLPEAQSAEARIDPDRDPADESAPVDAGAVIDARPALDNPAPRYPGLARRRGWEGEVVLSVAVDADGQPIEVTIDDSSGRRVLDEAAAAAVFRWRFLPASAGGVAVAGRASVRVAFVLEN